MDHPIKTTLKNAVEKILIKSLNLPRNNLSHEKRL